MKEKNTQKYKNPDKIHHKDIENMFIKKQKKPKKQHKIEMKNKNKKREQKDSLPTLN